MGTHQLLNLTTTESLLHFPHRFPLLARNLRFALRVRRVRSLRRLRRLRFALLPL
jgi:hypothetical protein